MQLRQPSSAWLRCEFARHLLCQTAAPRRAWPAGLCSKATLVTGAAGVRLAALASRAEAGATNLSDPSYSYGAAKITDKLLPLDSVPPRSPAPQLRRGFFAFPGLHYSSPGRRILPVVGFTRCTSAQIVKVLISTPIPCGSGLENGPNGE